MELTEEGMLGHYLATFDERTRAAHYATLAFAAATEPNGWPTIPMVRNFARLFGGVDGRARGLVWADVPYRPGQGALGGRVAQCTGYGRREAVDDEEAIARLRHYAGDA